MVKFFICIYLFLESIVIFGQTNDIHNSNILNDKEKMFIAKKISKIQADHDDLIKLHKDWQDDTVDYYDHGGKVLIQLYNRIGNNCFTYSPNKVQTYDIETNKIVIDGIKDSAFSIYHSYIHNNGKQYFLAIDDSGWVFLLNNFWIDEFNRFIRQKYREIKGIEKALEVVRLFISTKLYSPFNKKKVIIENGNINQYNKKYSYLQPITMMVNNKGLYEFSLYTVSPYSEEVCFYDFHVSKTGEINYTEVIKNESIVTD